MKIVALTSETPSNVWLVNQLMSRHDISAIVIERRPMASSAQEKRARRRQMVRRHGLLRTINKLLFNRFRSVVLRRLERRTATECFFPAGAPIAYTRPVPTLVVETVNDPAAVDFIKAHGAALLAVCGTSVLKPHLFTAAPLGAINIHTGITPEYRSADPIFWALYNGEPQKVGVTIHYIDRGIDTGAIIRQQTVPVYPDDSLASISARCIRQGAELYSQAITGIENGTVRILDRSAAPSRAFYSIDLGLAQYLIFLWRFRRLASRLGDRPPTRMPASEPLR